MGGAALLTGSRGASVVLVARSFLSDLELAGSHWKKAPARWKAWGCLWSP